MALRSESQLRIEKPNRSHQLKLRAVSLETYRGFVQRLTVLGHQKHIPASDPHKANSQPQAGHDHTNSSAIRMPFFVAASCLDSLPTFFNPTPTSPAQSFTGAARLNTYISGSVFHDTQACRVNYERGKGEKQTKFCIMATILQRL